MKEKWIPEKLYRQFMKNFPIMVVDAVIKDRRGVLLTLRSIKPYKGYWTLPGGGVNRGETLKDAAKREVLEETGLKVEVVKYNGYYDSPLRDRRRHAISHVFICKAVGGKLKTNHETENLEFFKKLPKKIGFDHRKLLNDAGVR
jgi:8-oxo-dGTP diphosphatase